MSAHTINLAIRFLLEVAALVSMGLWVWHATDGWLRAALTPLVPLTAAVVWVTFAVPDDPSRSGAAPIAVPGIVRLVIEAAVFVLAVWALNEAGFQRSSWTFGVIVILHYVASYDRMLWLVRTD